MRKPSPLARAEQAWTLETGPAARQAQEQALAEAGQDGVPAEMVAVSLSYGNGLPGSGQLDRAADVVGQVACWAEHDFASAVLQVRYYHPLGERDAWQSSLQRARSLAGERNMGEALTRPPEASGGQPRSIRIH